MRKAKTTADDDAPKRRPSATPEAEEAKMISSAIRLAAKQLEDGTASSQVITHYLKLASKKERMELEILEEQKKLLKAKTEVMESQKRTEELYAEALKAMRVYTGKDDETNS